MPPFSVGFAQVEHRLGIVRRRLNLFMLQDALYRSGSLAALATALLVALALRGRAALFAVAAWAAIGAFGAAAVAAILRVRRRWRSVEQVVRWADREAGLEDRLATLLLDPARARGSRLSDMLLEQILAAAPRWDVDTLAPRRVPRSLFVLVAALAALIATSFFLRPPAVPLSSPVAAPLRQPSTEAAAESMRSPLQSNAVGETLRVGAMAKQGGGQPDGATNAAGRSAAGSKGGSDETSARAAGQSEGHPSAPFPGQNADSSGINNNAPSVDRSSELAKAAEGGMPQQLQDAIRQGLGAPRPDEASSGPRGARGADTNLPQSDSDARDALARRNPEPNANRDSNTTQRSDESPQPNGAAGKKAGTGSVANAGSQSGEAAAELFGEAPTARTGGRESQRLAIKLGAFAAMAPNQVEPQRQAPPVGAVPFEAARQAPPPLSDEQVPDAPLQKADVAPEHETLVRRIFTRE